MNFKINLIALSLAIAGCTLAQDSATKITYSTVAVPVGRALTEMSKGLSVRLEATVPMANEIVVIRFKEATLDEAMKRIATVTAGSWEQMDGGYRLIPNSAARRQEEQAEKAAYTASLTKSLQDLVKTLNPPKPDPNKKTDPEAEAMMAQFGFGAATSPAGKAIIRLLQAIGPASLANINEKTRVVYSSRPTRVQVALPGNTSQILAQLVTEHNAYAKELQNQKAAQPVNTEQSEQVRKMREFFGNFMDEDKPIVGTPTKANLVLTRQQLLGGISAVLSVFNDQGQVVVTGTQTINVSGSMLDGLVRRAQEIQGGAQTKAPATEEKPIEFSDVTKELESISNMMQMANAPKMSDELRNRLLHPDEFDPLSFSESEGLLAIANLRNKQLVAVLPDSMESMLGMLGGDNAKTTPTAFLKDLKSAVSVVDDGQWMVVRPLTPAEARQKRFDRPALARFIQAVDSKGTCDLDDLATYAQKSESPMENQSTMRYIIFFAPTAMQSGFMSMTNWDMLRFYGALPVGMKNSLIEGGRIPFSQLNPTQRAALQQMAFGPDQSISVERNDEKKPDYELPGMMKQLFQRSAGGDFRSEPTEVMPNGLPSNGYVIVNFSQEPVTKATGNVPTYLANASLGMDELALLKYFSEMPSMAQFSAMMPRLDQLRVGERKLYNFKFMLAPGVSITQTLHDDSFPKNGKIVSMANLPEDMQKRVQDRIAAIKKIPFFDPAFLGGGRQQTAPPQ